MDNSRNMLIAVFVSSLCSLAYEITLMRIFAITLWYHFAFMVISIAMLGIGASGTFLSVFPKGRDLQRLPLYFLMLSVSIPASYILVNLIPFEPVRLSWDRLQIFYIGLYYIILSMPFFSFGLVMATAFSGMRDRTGYTYGADLLGAGTGSLAIMILLGLSGPDRTVFAVSSVSCLSLFICGRKRMRLVALLILIFNVLVLVGYPSLLRLRISPFKPLEQALRFPDAEHIRTLYSPFARVDLFKSPFVRYAPGLSLSYLEELPLQTGISIDAGDIHAITRSVEKEKLRFLSFLPSALPYEISHRKEVLVVEPRGGLPVLLAEYYGADGIFRVESNPLVVKAVRQYSEGMQDIYSDNTQTGLARSRLAAAGRNFDLIDIHLLGTMTSGSFGFSEDFRLTVEAFDQYLGHLEDEGMLALHLYIFPPPRTELRLLATLCTALERRGISNCGRHIAAIRSWDTVTLIAKNTPVAEGEVEAIKKFAAQRRFDFLWYPGVTDEETNVYIKMPSREYASAFREVIGRGTREDFIDSYMFDIRPVSDENPFPHYFLKVGKLKEIYRVMGSKWQYFIEEGYLLPAVFIQVSILGLFLMGLPAFAKRNRIDGGEGRTGDWPPMLAYFACLGIAYLFVEVSFVQKMILPLENPSYAAAAVLSSMLMGSGTGSIMSQRYVMLKTPRMILLLCIAVLLYGLLLAPMTRMIAPLGLAVRMIAAFIIVFPAGMFMGIPFPLGLSVLGSFNERLIPWAWAVNGCMSVLSPVLALMLAIGTGFRTVLLTGMALYLLSYFCLRAVISASQLRRP